MTAALLITNRMLATAGACPEARAALRTAFPSGMPLTPEALDVALAHPPGRDWLLWLLGSSLAPAPVWAEYARVTAAALRAALLRWGAGQ